MNRRRYLQTDEGFLINEEPSGQQKECGGDKIKFIQDKGILSYIQMLIELIDGRYVNIGEILKMLQKIWRQHSIDRRRRFIYAFTYSSQRPP